MDEWGVLNYGIMHHQCAIVKHSLQCDGVNEFMEGLARNNVPWSQPVTNAFVSMEFLYEGGRVE